MTQTYEFSETIQNRLRSIQASFGFTGYLVKDDDYLLWSLKEPAYENGFWYGRIEEVSHLAIPVYEELEFPEDYCLDLSKPI